MRLKSSKNQSAFTLIELMVVIAILGGLMALVSGVQRYAQNKGRRSRAEVQVAAFCAAAEAYKSDNAAYPRTPDTDAVSSVGASGAETASSSGLKANQTLYAMLSGDWDFDGKPDSSGSGSASAPAAYMAISASQLASSGGKVQFMQDPWGKAYGYSTKRASAIEAGADDAGAGHNVTFDVWSTAGNDKKEKAWIGNW